MRPSLDQPSVSGWVPRALNDAEKLRLARLQLEFLAHMAEIPGALTEEFVSAQCRHALLATLPEQEPAA